MTTSTHSITEHEGDTCAVCSEAVKNPNADLLLYTGSDLVSVRVQLAGNTATPLAVLRVLADDAHPAVRQALRLNSILRREHDIRNALYGHDLPAARTDAE